MSKEDWVIDYDAYDVIIMNFESFIAVKSMGNLCENLKTHLQHAHGQSF